MKYWHRKRALDVWDYIAGTIGFGMLAIIVLASILPSAYIVIKHTLTRIIKCISLRN